MPMTLGASYRKNIKLNNTNLEVEVANWRMQATSKRDNWRSMREICAQQ